MIQGSLHVIGTDPARFPVTRLLRFLQVFYAGVIDFAEGSHVALLGEPDLPGGYYSDDVFVAAIPNKPHDKNLALVLTEVPIEGNFFARSVRNVSIMTTFQADLALRGSEFKQWDYLRLKCIQEIFWIVCKISAGNLDLHPLLTKGGLFHFDRQGCLFNFSAHKLVEQVEKLRWAKIETACAERARNTFRVSGDFIKASRRALHHLVRPTLAKTFAKLMSVPWSSFAYGAVVGGLLVNIASAYLLDGNSTSPTPLALLISLLSIIVGVPVGWYLWLYLQYRRRVRDDG